MDQILAEATPIALQIVGLIVSALLMMALNSLRARMKIQLSEAQERHLRDIVHRGVAYAEEEVARRIKVGEIDPKPRDRQAAGLKLAAAVEYVRSFAPLMAESKIVREIHTELAQTPGLGATGARVVDKDAR